MSGAEEHPDEGTMPAYQLTSWLVIGAVIVAVILLMGVRLEHQPETSRDYPARALMADAEPTLLEAPELYDEYVPCKDCHAGRRSRPEIRELEDEHEDNVVVHGNLWCHHCHDPENVTFLHLADGAQVAMEDSWKLCTQCHAEKLADWRAGVHGKRTGHWRGSKEYRTCVVCHEPHAPAFAAQKPKPPPVRPENLGVLSGTLEPVAEEVEDGH